jgi:hypothetical protein
MSESVDLRRLLAGWAYRENENLRIVRGDDGREILQVRLPLGIEQLELQGRPDGQRPHGRESVLDYHLHRLAEAKAAGQEGDFEIEPEECQELFSEGNLYYQRYLYCFQLHRFQETVRDTARNLRLFDFAHRHSAREEDRLYLEKWRPYVVRMNAAARAMIEVGARRHQSALQTVREATDQIESLAELDDETFRYERKRSLLALREFINQLERTRPRSETEKLEQELRKAVAAQQFERAAVLRDRLRDLRQSKR